MKIIPATKEEFNKTGWKQADVILVSGDAYVDHPAFGAAVIARSLQSAGYNVAVIDQPDLDDPDSITVFGEPKLFFAVSSGNVDSMLMKYTAFKKVRNDDPFSPGNAPVNRYERSVIRYCNSIKKIYKDVPIVLGGMEASMRRLFHYDYWSNSVRRSILEDSRADLLIYGMGEKQILQIAELIHSGKKPDYLYGTVLIKKNINDLHDYILLDDEKNVIESKNLHYKNYRKIIKNIDKTIVQPSGKRYIVQYPPAEYTSEDLDNVYALPYTRKPHSKYREVKIPAFEMIKFSINSHRGCASGCAFCSIFLHQGKKIISRSEKSIIDEAKIISQMKYFKGHITDIGGPSANMYNSYCSSEKSCSRTSCLHPNRCSNFKTDQLSWISLAEKVLALPNVKHVTIGSGLRYDLFMKDNPELLRGLIKFIGGQLKIAPEHTDEIVLKSMHKNPLFELNKFVKKFKEECNRQNKKYYIVPYLMSNHPGSTLQNMKKSCDELQSIFGVVPDQVQSFIPLPMTQSSVGFYTGKDPETGESVFSEKDFNMKRKQHDLFFNKKYGNNKTINKRKHRRK